MEIKFRVWDGKEMNYKDLGAFVSIDDMTITPVRCELMQFTGLKDSQGNEIYEGDILDFDEREWGGKFEPEVIEMDKIIGDWEYCGSLWDVAEWRTVIGNKYQNPELCGG